MAYRYPSPFTAVIPQRLLFWSLLGGLTPAITTPLAFAQAAPAIEEVTVTAARRAQSLLDFSGAISVIKPEGTPHVTLTDIAHRVPGLTIIDAGPRNPAGMVMRGLRLDPLYPNDLGGDGGSVASYLDNIPLQGHFVPPAISLKDLQHIEAVRGPQGTLYGNASIGGLVRYITAKPDLSKPGVSVSAAASQTRHSDGFNYDTDLVVNMPLSENTLGVRLLLGKEHNEGFIDNPYLLGGAREDINDDASRVARISALWQPSAEFSLAGSYHLQKDRVGDRQAGNPAFTGDRYTASSRYPQPMNGDLHLSSIDASYQFSLATMTASINRYDYTNRQQADQTDHLLTLDTEGGWDFYTADENFSAFTRAHVDMVKDSAELRLVSDEDRRLRWLVGAFYSTDELSVSVADTAPGFAEFIGLDRSDDLDYYATQTEDLAEYSLYSELAYDLTPPWELSVGIRSFRYNDDVVTCSAFPISDMLEGDELDLQCMDGSDRHNGTLGKISSKYKLNDNHNIYFTVAEGFRRGGANVLPVDIQHSRNYRPDTAVNYELGTHAYLLNQQLYLSGALFYMDWKDIHVATTVEDYYGAIVNAKSARTQGVELEARVQLPAGWSLHSGFAFTDAELREDVMSINGGAANAYAGDTLPGSPRYQFNLGVDYTRVFNQVTLDTALELARMSESYTALNPEFADYDRLDGFTLANARADVSWRNWRVGAFVRNIGDTQGVTAKRTSRQFGEQGQYEVVTRPRTVGLAVNYRY